jgi:hypothetical protein
MSVKLISVPDETRVVTAAAGTEVLNAIELLERSEISYASP